MNIMLLDFETTGLNTNEARIIQSSITVWDTVTNNTQSDTQLLYCPTSYPKVSKEIEKLTGVSQEQLEREGIDPKTYLTKIAATIERVGHVAAHNGASFDKPLFHAECKRHGIPVPAATWIDTRTDIPYPDNLRCRVLSHVAFEHGIPVSLDRRHDASYDVHLMLEILKKYDIAEIIKIASSPWMVVRANVSYDDRELAKAQKFSWEKLDGLVFNKSWVKKVREGDLQKASQDWNFKWEAKPLENYATS